MALTEPLASVHHSNLGRPSLGLDQGDVGARPIAEILEPSCRGQDPIEPLQAGLGVAERLAGRKDPDVGDRQIADLDPDGILILELDRLLRVRSDGNPRQSLVRIINRMRDVEVVLERAALAFLGVSTIRDELAVGVEDRVGPETGGEDVGLGQGDLELAGLQVEVLADQEIQCLVERQAIGWPFVRDRREVERAEKGNLGQRGNGRDCGLRQERAAG